MRNVKQVDLFISSPGEMAPERRLLERVCDNLNRDQGSVSGFSIRTLDWIRDVRPQVGSSGQEIISEEIGKNYDIYVGFLGTFYGSETGTHRSGTEQEFREAFERFKDSGSPEILFYFAKRDVPIHSIDPNHLALIKQFKDGLASSGVFYAYFVDEIDLTLRLQREIGKTIRKVLKDQGESLIQTQDLIETFTSAPQSLPNYEALLEQDPLARAAHLLNDASSRMDLVAENLVSTNTVIGKFNHDLVKHTKAWINQRQLGNQSEAIDHFRMIDKIVAQFGQKLYDSIPRLHNDTLNALELLQRSIEVWRLTEKNIAAEMITLKPSIQEFRRSLVDWEDPISSFMIELKKMEEYLPEPQTFQKLRALSSDLLEFGRRVQKVIDDFFDYLDEILGSNWESYMK